MQIKEDLTARDVLQISREMNREYQDLARQTHLALGKIDNSVNELKKAREYYEGSIKTSITKTVENHPKLTVSFIFVILSLVITLIFFYIKDKGLELNEDGFKTTKKEFNNKVVKND